MIEVGDIVIVRPQYSLRFAGRRGKVVRIDSSDDLPVYLDFGDNNTYRFAPMELLTIEEFNDYENYSVTCEVCGKPTPALSECEDCFERKLDDG